MNAEIKNSLERLATDFDALIDKAPAESVASDSSPVSSPINNLVRESHGWGSKYVTPIELHGEKWLEKYEDAKRAVEACGIVAFLGGRGPGKTQMAAEVARAGKWPQDAGEWNGLQTVRTKTALYRRAMDVFLDLRDASSKTSDTSEKKVLAKLEAVGLLVIDEFQERGESPWENRIICNLLDKRYAAQRPTILIANYTRQEMANALSDSVKDRIRENGKAIIFDWPSYRAK